VCRLTLCNVDSVLKYAHFIFAVAKSATVDSDSYRIFIRLLAPLC
jgi:hypothetical protein